MKIYKAERNLDAQYITQARVTVNGMTLDPGPSQRIWKHSIAFDFADGGTHFFFNLFEGNFRIG